MKPILGHPLNQPAIINPRPQTGEEPVAARVIQAFTRPDYQLLCRLAHTQGTACRLWDCAYRTGSWEGRPLTIVAPAMGAPYAAMVLEKLIALGAKMVLALGWCGSLQPEVRVGSLILPTEAVSADGTSPHYHREEGHPSPDPLLYTLMEQHLAAVGLPWHFGTVWTTDAFYRETEPLVRQYQSVGALGVELEMAALFAVGQFRGVAVAGLLLVSDELFTYCWEPGCRSARFRQAREQAARLVLKTAAAWEDGHA